VAFVSARDVAVIRGLLARLLPGSGQHNGLSGVSRKMSSLEQFPVQPHDLFDDDGFGERFDR